MKFSTIFQSACLVGAAFVSGASIGAVNDLDARSTLEAKGITGINCRGAGSCATTAGLNVSLRGLRDFVSQIDPNRWYANGEHIVCQEKVAGFGFCVYLQNTGGAPGFSIMPLMDALVQHNCGLCGSVPLFYPQGDNNAEHGGWLTVNYVNRPNCNGIC